MAVNNQLEEGLESFTCTKTWIDWSFTERMTRVMSRAFHKIQMQPLEPSASKRQTLSKPREELIESALWLEMRVSKIMAMEGRWEQTISVKFLQKFGLPAPVQFQTSIFIERKLKGLVMWAWPVIHFVCRGAKRLRGCVFRVQSEAEGYEIHWGVQHGVGGKSEAEYTVLYWYDCHSFLPLHEGKENNCWKKTVEFFTSIMVPPPPYSSKHN